MMVTKANIKGIIYHPASIAPLINFRVLFGLILLISLGRFAWYDWIEAQYLSPQFHFSYFGFNWVKPLGTGMYLLFGIMALASIGIILGFLYRISALVFFLSFTYVELIDVSNYLNHYYFVSIMALLLAFLPAHREFSIDAWRKPKLHASHIPNGFLLVLQVMIGLVYFYAGLAKLNTDWLFHALPLRIWLPPYTGLPLVGSLMDELWVAYAFSWFGAIYDLTIPFFLFYRKTRPYAFIAVIIFHMVTWILFPIGMFPFIMIFSATVFFSADFHDRILRSFQSVLKKLRLKVKTNSVASYYQPSYPEWVWGFLGIFLFIQILLPWRFMAYPGNLYWTEQGYRFSWRVMLMEKAGYAIFHIKDPDTGKEWEEYAHDYLTPVQEKQMSTQPDMILQFAHFLEKQLVQQGITDPEVRAEVYVSLNGRGSRLFLDPKVDLTLIKEGFHHKSWVLPYKNQ
ncbi:MAG: HTTM domain-containing protein [Anditalea sp.]